MTLTLGYWDVRAYNQSIILILEYLGEKYEFIGRSTSGESMKEWFDVEKPKMKSVFDFPNLPYLIDGETKLTDSFAIMRYLARKHNDLLPSTEKEIQQADVAQGVVQDLRSNLTSAMYNKHIKFEPDGRKTYFGLASNKLDGMEKVLKRQAWIAGEKMTFVDFALAEHLDQLRLCYPGVLDKYPSVKKYVEKFDAVEKIKEYRGSSKYSPFPVYGVFAQWGGKKE